MGWQLSVFRKVVGDVMRPAPLTVPGATLCRAVVERLAEANASSVLIVDDGGKLRGIFTERDVLRRVVLSRDRLDRPIEDSMSLPVETVGRNDPLYEAIARMQRRGLRHMPVVDDTGRPAGMIDLHEALSALSGSMIEHIDRLTQIATIQGLRDTKRAQIALAEELVEARVPTPEIQALLSAINNDLYRRCVERTLAAMEAEGWGPPPRRFCAIVMGSGGRGENYLNPDQDNGFIIEDYPDDAHNSIDPYFRELAGRMTLDLDRIGFPLCRGDCMASNPLWRKTLSQWRRQISLWGRKRSTVTIRLADIFFDFTAVWGDSALADDLRAHVTAFAARNPAFLIQMFREEVDNHVALGLFGRLRTESAAEHRGQIDLKHAGALPLIEAIRLMSLREAVPETSTLGRIAELHRRGVLSDDEEDYLAGAFRHITRLLMRTQIAEVKAGRQPGNFLDPKALTRRDREWLVDSFRAIDDLRKRIRHEFTAELF